MRANSIILMLCAGCNPTETTVPEEVSSESASTTPVAIAKRPPVTIVDRTGRSVTFESVPQRIVSLSPASTELLFAIGAGSSVVGATNHCNYPADALKVPRVGSGIMEGTSRETILALKPDLVLCKWDTHEPLMELFDRVGIQAINIGPETLEELFDEARLLGRVTGHEQGAESLISQMTERRDRLAQRVASLSPNQQRTVFYEVWDDPLMTAGPKSFIGELLRMGKMKNVFEDTDVSYPCISSEVVVDRNPDVILTPTNHLKQVEVQRLASRPGWANIRAITDKRVFIINGDEVSRCGPRMLNALEQMIDAVYPETKLKEPRQP
ncbi:MAG: helical backbone metal receptor [Planctomycetota bacterium]|nr:helical backbone metal receptor [Planctomycetota bacterium]